LIQSGAGSNLTILDLGFRVSFAGCAWSLGLEVFVRVGMASLLQGIIAQKQNKLLSPSSPMNCRLPASNPSIAIGAESFCWSAALLQKGIE
jgi:hypothetical protein